MSYEPEFEDFEYDEDREDFEKPKKSGFSLLTALLIAAIVIVLILWLVNRNKANTFNANNKRYWNGNCGYNCDYGPYGYPYGYGSYPYSHYYNYGYYGY